MKIEKKEIFEPITITVETFAEANAIYRASALFVDQRQHYEQIELDTCRTIVNKLATILDKYET